MAEMQLFISRNSTMPKNERFYFYDTQTDRLLIYTDKATKKECVPVSENDISLTPYEQSWLNNCKKEIALEIERENLEKAKELFKNTLDRFEDHLKIAMKELEQKGGDADGQDR
jgi:uncharacterized protein YhbP (UPF0306 family)